MEQKQQLTTEQAFEVVYKITSEIALKRNDMQLLDASLKTIADVLGLGQHAPQVEGENK